MKFLDVHCHLDLVEKEMNIETMMQHARAAEVVAITQGVDPQSNRRVIETCKRYKEVKAALGLYPIDALKLSDSDVDKEIDYIKSKRNDIIAIGEVGLDYKDLKDQGSL